jgi:ATP-dependent Clp protease ATP-binding subunit ClpA
VLERFTKKGRRVVALAQEEARLLEHAQIDTAHLLVALTRVEDGAAARVLRVLGLSPERARQETVRLAGYGSRDGAPPAELPLTPAAKDALDAARREALALGHDRVTDAHVLLGLLAPFDAVARRVLVDAGLDIRTVRRSAVAELARPEALDDDEVAPAPLEPPADARLLLGILARDGPAAALLRDRGVDEQDVRALLDASPPAGIPPADS